MSARILSSPGQEITIKRLVRHRQSHEYFKRGGWTTDPTQADTFSDSVEAAQACARYGLKDVELALRYDAAACDVFCTPIS